MGFRGGRVRPAFALLRAALCRGTCVLVAGTAALVGTGGGPGADRARGTAAPVPAPQHRALAGSEDHTRPLVLPALYRVGALLPPGGGGHGHCTAGVVDSPHRNLLITAAHCVYDGPGSDYRAGLDFSPGNGTGHGPAGLWQMRAAVMDPGWTSGADPDLDVAFVILRPRAGRDIQDLAGGNPLGFGRRSGRVGLIGYPSAAGAAHTCVGQAHPLGGHQLWIYCPDFTSGTSGTPWLAGADADSTGSGTLIGVLGGREHGGATADISYSSYFGAEIAALYRRAVAAS